MRVQADVGARGGDPACLWKQHGPPSGGGRAREPSYPRRTRAGSRPAREPVPPGAGVQAIVAKVRALAGGTTAPDEGARPSRAMPVPTRPLSSSGQSAALLMRRLPVRAREGPPRPAGRPEAVPASPDWYPDEPTYPTCNGNAWGRYRLGADCRQGKADRFGGMRYGRFHSSRCGGAR